MQKDWNSSWFSLLSLLYLTACLFPSVYIFQTKAICPKVKAELIVSLLLKMFSALCNFNL